MPKLFGICECLEGTGPVAGGEELGAVDGGPGGAGHGAGLRLQVLGAVAGEGGGHEGPGRCRGAVGRRGRGRARRELDGEVRGRRRGGRGREEEGWRAAPAPARPEAARGGGEGEGDGGRGGGRHGRGGRAEGGVVAGPGPSLGVGGAWASTAPGRACFFLHFGS